MLRLAGEAVVGEGIAGEVHPASHGEAAAHGDQEGDVRDAGGVVCHTCSLSNFQHILQRSRSLTILERRRRSDDGGHCDDAPDTE